ncbi:hypothetical protein B0H14DRAFT_3144245 [Mycena olivaceomarginata]|nr:hypothetical protein B0H14DRAFT_3144245 [Mycena olivaceomarginata]
MSAHTIRVQLCIVAASDVPSNTRLFASIRVPAQKNRLDTAVSRTAQWNETFPFLLLTLSAPVELEIAERCRLRKSKLLGTTKTTIEEMLKMAGNNQGFVVLAMKPFKPVVVSPQLTLSIRIHELDVGSVSAQLGNLYLSDIGSPNSDELFQQVLYRLECLTRFTSGIAQSDLEFAQTIKDHVATNKKLTNREQASPAMFLISDDKHRAEKLLEELNELHIRMTQALTLGVAWNVSKVQDQLELSLAEDTKDKQLFKLLNPLSMEMVPPSTRDVCFPGTRTNVVSEITQWGLSSPDKVLWIGKTTIAMTMANVFEGMGRLGSFVFFNRDVEERSEPSRMVRTIAYQLSRHREDIADGIHRCVRKRSHINNMPMHVQFQELLVEPLMHVKNDERVVIIIDALDEGGQGYYQEAFLKLLSQLPQLPDFVRILITSRKYPQIQHAFSKVPDLRVLDLNEVPDIDDDIHRFILAHMDDIRREHPHLPTTWPGMEAVDSLVKHARGLFIWATVACAYIKADEPAEHIKTLLSNPSERQLQEESLDNLYTIAIHAAGNWDQAKFAKDMHSVLSIIIFSQNPQSLECIGELLEMTHIRTSEMISRLQSIIRTDQNGMVHAIHPSVHDYLVDPRSVKPTAELAHTIYTFFSKHLMHWLEALGIMGQSRSAITSLNQLQDWYSKLDEVSTLNSPFATLLHDAWRFSMTFPMTIEASPALIYTTALSFCPKNTSIPAMFPPEQDAHIASAYLCGDWSPSLMTLTGLFMEFHPCPFHDLDGTIAAGCVDGTLKVWNTFTGMEIFTTPAPPDDLTDGTMSIQLCSDGMRLFYALVRGGIQGKDYLYCAALAPDDPHNYLRVWDIESRLPLSPLLVAHQNAVAAFAFSHNQPLVISGSDDSTVQMWSWAGVHQMTFRKEVMPPLCLHHGPILALAFSPDDKAIISGSRDTQIRIWSLVNLHRQVSVQPRHTAEIQCIALSHNQKYFASGSRDTTIIVWNTSDGSAVFSPLKGHKAEIVALEISPDDKILVSASTDGSIYFWDLETGQMNGAPLKHSEEVISIKLSPDGLRLASITNSTLTVWGVSNRDYLLGPLAYPGHEYRAIAFSNNGAHMAILCGYVSERQMDNVLGLEITIREAMKGIIVLTKQIDIQGGNIYWPTMQYAIEDKYFILRYAVDQAIISRAFDVATGQDYKDSSESPHIPEFCQLAAMGSQILGTEGLIFQLPEDFGHMGTIIYRYSGR